MCVFFMTVTASPANRSKKLGQVVVVSVGSLVLVLTLAIAAWHLLQPTTKGMTTQELELGDVSDDGEPHEEEFQKGAVPKRFHY
jgi:hypothetical protein